MRRGVSRASDYDATSNDPAEWNSCSTAETAIDALEPEPEIQNAYREAALRNLRVLECVITFISTARDARLASIQVSVALGLHPTFGMKETAIARELGMSRQAFSRGAVRFLRMSQLPPAFGLKSLAARMYYQQTNGQSQKKRCH